MDELRAAGADSAHARVEFELTPEEWVEVSLEHSFRSRLLREGRRKVTLLLAMLFMLLALLWMLEGATAVAATWLLGGGVLIAILGPLLRSAQRRQLRAYADMGIAHGMFGSHRVELRPEGMVDITSYYERLTRWPAIDRVEESEGAFLVYMGANALLPIPHSAFRDSASLRRFSDAFYRLREGASSDSLPPGDATGPTSDVARG